MEEYPKMLFKPGTSYDWDGIGVDFLTVGDAAEEADAIAAGWSFDRPGEEAPKRGRPRKTEGNV